ncbi:hypothetical protein HDE_09492 [Halotydeus destructor]|nr:hypothetical protein HDE_09492 [Halotydeus destructor]
MDKSLSEYEIKECLEEHGTDGDASHRTSGLRHRITQADSSTDSVKHESPLEVEVVTSFGVTILLNAVWLLDIVKISKGQESSILGSINDVAVKLTAVWNDDNNLAFKLDVPAEATALNNLIYELVVSAFDDKYDAVFDRNSRTFTTKIERESIENQFKQSGDTFATINLIVSKAFTEPEETQPEPEAGSYRDYLRSFMRNLNTYRAVAQPYLARCEYCYDKISTLIEISKLLMGANQTYVKSIVVIGLSSIIMSGIKDIDKLKQDNLLMKAVYETRTSEFLKAIGDVQSSQSKLFKKIEHLERDLSHSIGRLKRDLNDLEEETEDTSEQMMSHLNHGMGQKVNALEKKIGQLMSVVYTEHNPNDSPKSSLNGKEIYKKLNQGTTERQQLRAKLEMMEQNFVKSTAYVQNFQDKVRQLYKLACDSLPSWAATSLCSKQFKFENMPKFLV